jgi:GTPase SAR1 family protein
MTVEMSDSGSKNYKLELWDTRSVESYKIIEEMKNCEFSVALICYSVMEIKSFEEVKKKVRNF